MKNITNLLLAALVVLVAIGIFKNHSLDLNVSEHKNNTVTISGKAEKEVVPDTARISFAVNEYNKKQNIAADRVNKKVKKILSAVKDLDIDEKDIKTQNYTIHPEYTWNGGKRLFKDYRASQRVELKVRDLDKTSKVIKLLAENKADNINGPNMFVGDREKIQEELRAEAIEDAQKKAHELANELGVSLSKIISFSESGSNNYYPRPMYKMSMALDNAAGQSVEAPEINPGEEKITKTVSITFQIED